MSTGNSKLAAAAPAAAGEDIAGAVRTGLVLTGSADTVRQVLETATGIVLARLLLPSDFGVVAVVASLLQVSFVISNFGLAGAVVQARELSDADRNAAFAFSTAIGFLLMAIVTLGAPWAATYFRMPALTSIAPVMSIQLLLSGMSAIPLAFLRRELAFGRVASIDISAAILYALIGIPLALLGFGVWSLVWAPLAAALWTAAASIVVSGYRPGLALDRDSFRSMLRFGSGLTLKNVFVYVGRNLDNLIVAKMLGDAPVGLYTRAFNLTRLPQNRMVTVVYRVCFPAFCRFQDDMPRLHRWFANATALVAVGATPLLLGLAAISEDFVLGVLGPNWAGMVTTVRILCVGALISCFHTLGGAAIEASGRIGYEVATQGLHAFVIVFGCIAGARYGIEGVAWAVVAAAIALYTSKAITLKKAIGLSARSYMGAALPALTAGIFMVACVYLALAAGGSRMSLLAPGSHWPRMFFGIAVGVAAYAAALAVVARPPLNLVIEQVQLYRRGSGSRRALSSGGVGG
jgi:PST family polysaccharide transporter